MDIEPVEAFAGNLLQRGVPGFAVVPQVIRHVRWLLVVTAREIGVRGSQTPTRRQLGQLARDGVAIETFDADGLASDGVIRIALRGGVGLAKRNGDDFVA